MNIYDWGNVPNYENLPGIPARITAQHKERYEIVCAHGITHARLKTKEYYVNQQDFPTTGDFVMINYIDNGDSQIIATLPRATFFSRREPGPIPRDQAVAANFDYVFIMQSLNQDFNPKRLERYLTLAWQSGATPVILLTKADLVEDYWEYLTQVERVAAGVNTHVVSAHTGQGLNRLNEREKKILHLRFFEGRTQMEVAGEIGISQAQVSRLEKNALLHMRRNIQAAP